MTFSLCAFPPVCSTVLLKPENIRKVVRLMTMSNKHFLWYYLYAVREHPRNVPVTKEHYRRTPTSKYDQSGSNLAIRMMCQKIVQWYLVSKRIVIHNIHWQILPLIGHQNEAFDYIRASNFMKISGTRENHRECSNSVITWPTLVLSMIIRYKYLHSGQVFRCYKNTSRVNKSNIKICSRTYHSPRCKRLRAWLLSRGATRASPRIYVCLRKLTSKVFKDVPRVQSEGSWDWTFI